MNAVRIRDSARRKAGTKKEPPETGGFES